VQIKVVRTVMAFMESIDLKMKKNNYARSTNKIESIVQQRFGDLSLRIFRLLRMKKQLEQKQVSHSPLLLHHLSQPIAIGTGS